MRYEIKTHYGNDGSVTKIVENVVDLQLIENVYFFYDEESNVLFSAPVSNIVYIIKN